MPPRCFSVENFWRLFVQTAAQQPSACRPNRRCRLRFGLYAALCVVLSTSTGCKRNRIGPLRVPPPPSFFNTSPIHIDGFADDAAVRHRVIAMPFGEAAARLGSLHFESRTHFAFSQGAGRSYEQSDKASVHHDSQGNVHVTSATPAAQVELITAGDKVFVRYDTGQLRQKTRRDVDIDELPEKAFAGMSQVLNLFAHIAYTEARQDSIGGRSVTRYKLKNDSSQAPVAPAAVPPSGVRLPAAPPGRWREEARPVDLAGTMAIDNETGVLLEAEVDGRLEIRDPAVRVTTLVVHHSHAVSEAGTAGNVRAPTRYISEFRRPIRPRDPLSFFRDNLGSVPSGATSAHTADIDEDETISDRPGAPPPASED